MFIAFLIMLREGIEAALIVGIIAGYLKQTGRERALPGVWLGVGLACVLCLGLGIALNAGGAEFPQRAQELFEGGVALLAAAMLLSMVLWMGKAARSIKTQLREQVDVALRSGGRRELALACMAFLAVGREGLESVFFLIASVEQAVGMAVPIGAALGLLAALAFGIGIYRGGLKINLRRFFRFTGVFIIFVAAGLLTGALRAFHEAGIWNVLQTRAFDFSAILPKDSPLGTLLAGIFGYQEAPTVAEVIAYFAFLLPTLTLFLATGRPRTALSWHEPRTS